MPKRKRAKYREGCTFKHYVTEKGYNVIATQIRGLQYNEHFPKGNLWAIWCHLECWCMNQLSEQHKIEIINENIRKRKEKKKARKAKGLSRYVYYDRNKNDYIVTITRKGERINGGRYRTIEDAEIARNAILTARGEAFDMPLIFKLIKNDHGHWVVVINFKRRMYAKSFARDRKAASRHLRMLNNMERKKQERFIKDNSVGTLNDMKYIRKQVIYTVVLEINGKERREDFENKGEAIERRKYLCEKYDIPLS